MRDPNPTTDVDIVDAADADAFSPPEIGVERLFRWITEIIMVLLMAMVGVELVVRGAFAWSLQATAELGGYAVVAITFLSMSTCLVNHSYHRVHFVESRLSPRGKALLRLGFDLLSFVVSLVLVWQCARFELISWNSGDVAPTNLLTPYWIPRLVMVIGFAGLAFSLLRTLIGDLRRLRSASNL
ncbi:TRAP transporter small permease subunit [Azospirillum doebereinerae]